MGRNEIAGFPAGGRFIRQLGQKKRYSGQNSVCTTKKGLGGEAIVS
jgi:hypothetical protein